MSRFTATQYRNAEELERELEMMTHPMRWPRLVLPVKRVGRMNETGSMGILLGDGPKVYFANLFQLPSDWSDVPRKEYDDYEAMIADGWVVD